MKTVRFHEFGGPDVPRPAFGRAGPARRAQVDAGRLRIEVAERVPLAELSGMHARVAAGAAPGGKVTVTV